MMVKLAVIGAGINGLTCALNIKEKYKDYDVTLISQHFSPNTTGDASGGLWYPYLCGDTPEHLLTKWGGETYKYLHKLWLEGGYDVSLMPIYDLYTDIRNFRRHQWRDIVLGYQELGRKELDYLSWLYSAKYTAGHSFQTFIIPPTPLLQHYSRLFQELNGQLLQAEVMSLQDPILNGFQVVNCTGVGARSVVPDSEVYPIRGQVAKMIAPWINVTVIDEDGGNYIIPNTNTCVLGGTHQENNCNTNIDEEDIDFIVNGCQTMVPGLKHAALVKHSVGLRPGRCQIRLEAEVIEGKLFIHNYGHGGSGLTLFRGCAAEVLQIIDNLLEKKILKCRL